MIKTIARYAALGAIFLIPLIPFLVTESMFFPFITGKNFAFRILVEIALCAYALLAVAVPAYRPKRSWIFLAMGLFVVVVGLADMFGINPARSFWSNYERMEGFITILHLAAYLLVLGSVLRVEKMWDRLWDLSIGVSAVLSLTAFLELARFVPGQDPRVSATLGNPTYFAVFLLFNIFLALLMAYRRRDNRALAIAYLVAVGVQSIALYATQTRGTILGLIGGLLLAGLIILVKGRAHPRLRRLSGIVVLCIVIFAGLFFALKNTAIVRSNATLSRIANISLQDDTVQSRFILWTKIGWSGFKERPVLGWGQDNFIVVFGKYYDPLMYKQEPWFDRAHNVFVDWLIAGGALGLLSYLLLFAAGLWMLMRGTLPLPEKALFVGLLAAYAFHNIFVFDNLVSYILFAAVLGYLHARSLPDFNREVREHPNEGSTEGLPVVFGGAAVAAVLLVYFINVPYLLRSQRLIEALLSDYQKQYTNIEENFAKALTPSGLGREEAKEQLVQGAIHVWTSNAPEEVKRSLAGFARENMKESIANDPLNTRPMFFLGYLLTRVGPLEEGIATFRQALAINPSRQNFIYEIGRTYLQMKKYKESIATFKEASDKAPENDTALGYYAAALIFDGQIAAGEKVLTDRFGTTIVDNAILLDAYTAQGRLDQIAKILLARLDKLAPEDDAQTRYSLGVTYLQLGRRDDAIEQIEQAIALDSRFATQGNQIIAAIKAGQSIKINQ